LAQNQPSSEELLPESMISSLRSLNGCISNNIKPRFKSSKKTKGSLICYPP
jgi:hypothetical protein